MSSHINNPNFRYSNDNRELSASSIDYPSQQKIDPSAKKGEKNYYPNDNKGQYANSNRVLIEPKTLTINITGAESGVSYTFSGAVSGSNPSISANAGDTIIFNNQIGGAHPLAVKNSNGQVLASPSASGVTTFSPTSSGNFIYQCTVIGHENMTGNITIINTKVDPTNKTQPPNSNYKIP